jgi:4-hydroxy-tetrahydrodipicolinate synthase
MTELRGSITALVTPFDEDGRVDETAARTLARRQIENGIDGVVVSGTTGESPTLDDSEKLGLLRAVLDEIGGEAIVICGSGSNDTDHSERLSAAAADAGAHACLVVCPYYNKPNQAGISAHYEAVARAAGIPIIVYNIPSRCVINIAPDQLAELAQIENIVAVKQANPEEIGPIEGLNVLAGDDSTFLRCVESGGDGGILTSANVIPAEMVAVYEAATSGDIERARELDGELQPFYEAMFMTASPIPTKTALEMLGLASARLRLPMVPADDEQRAAIRQTLEAHGLLAASAS